jgi:methionyl-tRNA formyltransferase
LPIWQTSSLRGQEAQDRLTAVGAEAMVLAAFAALVPSNVLGLAPRGILNVHPSLLPRWRGAAPIQAALRAGEPETGVSIIQLVKALDAGPIFLQERLPIGTDDDYLSLEPRLAALGARLLVRTLAEQPQPVPQDEAGVTLAPRIARDDARIDWSSAAHAIRNQVRAYRAWPQAFTTWDGRQLKVLRAGALPHEAGAAPGQVSVIDGVPVVATGAGRLRLDEVQLEGKRALSGAAFLRGYAAFEGANLA